MIHPRSFRAREALWISRGGELPPRVLGLVAEWAALHKAELEEDWRRAQAREDLRPIPPLE